MNKIGVINIIKIASKKNLYPKDVIVMAAAVTATEMEFRTAMHRFFEYIYAAALVFLNKDASAISIGVSQISIRHYIYFEGGTQFNAIISLMSVNKSIETCCKIIEKSKCKNIEDLSRKYNGNSTIFYLIMLSKNYTIARELMNYPNNADRGR